MKELKAEVFSLQAENQMIKLKIKETDEESEFLKSKLQEVENSNDVKQELEESFVLSLQDELSTANVEKNGPNSVEIRSKIFTNILMLFQNMTH